MEVNAECLGRIISACALKVFTEKIAKKVNAIESYVSLAKEKWNEWRQVRNKGFFGHLIELLSSLWYLLFSFDLLMQKQE